MVSATFVADILRVAFSSAMARSASLACSAICGDVRGLFGGVKGTAFGLLPLLECCGVNGTAFGLLLLLGELWPFSVVRTFCTHLPCGYLLFPCRYLLACRVFAIGCVGHRWWRVVVQLQRA